MALALLVLSLGAAVTGGAVVWAAAGFWWAFAAYVGIGAVAVLLLGALLAAQTSRETEHSPRLAKREVAG